MRPRSSGALREARSRNLPAPATPPQPGAELPAAAAADSKHWTTARGRVPIFLAAVTWYSHVI